MTLDLEAIRKRFGEVEAKPGLLDADGMPHEHAYTLVGVDVPALLAEVERLRAEVAQQAPEQSTGVKAAQINVAPEVGAPAGAVEREIEDFRLHLEEVGRPVQIATRAVVNRAREVAATAHQMHDAGPKDGPVMRLLAAVRELERHEDALRGRAPYGEHLRCEDHPGRPMGHDGCEGAGEVTELNNAIPNLQGPHADGCSWMGRNVCDCGYAPAFTGEEMNDSAQPQGSTLSGLVEAAYSLAMSVLQSDEYRRHSPEVDDVLNLVTMIRRGAAPAAVVAMLEATFDGLAGRHDMEECAVEDGRDDNEQRCGACFAQHGISNAIQALIRDPATNRATPSAPAVAAGREALGILREHLSRVTAPRASLCNSSDACVLDDGHKEPCSRTRSVAAPPIETETVAGVGDALEEREK